MKMTLTIILFMISLVCFATPAKVKRIIDGDTFECESGETVRMIGINTPEISDIYGEEAKTHLEELIGGKNIELRTDCFSADKDRYNRLLRYVYVGDVDINKKMILDGFAFAYLKFHFENSYEYEQAQLKSKELNQGFWFNGEKDVKENVNFIAFKSLSPKRIFLIISAFILLIMCIYFFKK